jgi:hypothetical protein
MPGYLLTKMSQVKCSHAGLATPSSFNPRVKIMGDPIVLMPTTYAIAGCTLPPPPNGNGPCVSAQWASGATRIKSNTQPVLLQDSQASCAPTLTPLLVAATQARVKGM